MKKRPYRIDINCDLGEGEPLARTRALMREVTSANVACGEHAGSPRLMKTCIELAGQAGTRLGAHPGFRDRKNFGRKVLAIQGDELEMLLLKQVGALQKIADRQRVPLHHVKLHGGLYHAVEENESLARRYLAVVRRCWPELVVYALAGGTVHRCARASGLEVWGEAFADRRYEPDGRLTPRGRPDAMLTTTEALKQVRQLLEGGARVDTICIHGDAANAVRLAKKVAEIVKDD